MEIQASASMTRKQQALESPAYYSVVGGWGSYLQGAAKNDRGDSFSMHQPLFKHFLIINSLNPHNNPMRSW